MSNPPQKMLRAPLSVPCFNRMRATARSPPQSLGARALFFALMFLLLPPPTPPPLFSPRELTADWRITRALSSVVLPCATFAYFLSGFEKMFTRGADTQPDSYAMMVRYLKHCFHRSRGSRGERWISSIRGSLVYNRMSAPRL